MQPAFYRPAAYGLLFALCGGFSVTEVMAQRSRLVIPANTVIRLELAEEISSRTARNGERVTASLDENDRSGLPTGTRFEGVVTEVRRASDDRPAQLDMEFRRAVLPDGSVERIRGELASLSGDDTRVTEDGRLVSRRSGGGFDWKWVGIGAGGGAVLGEILGDDFLKGALLGGLGGAVYGYLNRGRDGDYREVQLDRGTEFGIRLEREIAFNYRPDYRFTDRTQVLGSRDELRVDEAVVRLDGRTVQLDEGRPRRINGNVYVPLRPIAQAAGWSLRHSPGADTFVLTTLESEVRGSVGDQSVSRNGRTFPLEAAPMRIDGEVYVPLEYLSRVGNVRVDWDRRQRQLDLRTSGRTTVALPPRIDLNALVSDLAAVDYTAVKANLSRYRIIDLGNRLDRDSLATLRTMLRENSGARRNRNLLTDLLRDGNRITNVQTVVGASRAEQIIYIQ